MCVKCNRASFGYLNLEKLYKARCAYYRNNIELERVTTPHIMLEFVHLPYLTASDLKSLT